MKINNLIENRFFFMRLRTKDGGFYNYIEKPMIDIDRYIKRKEKDVGFWLNQLKSNCKDTHSADMFDIPCFAWIDIDFHNKESKIEFLEDIKKKYKNVDEFLDTLKKDKSIFMIGRTLGGGIRIIGVYDYLYDLDSDTNEEEYETYFIDKQKELYSEITNDFTKYICKYGLRMDRKYMDKCSTKISQPTFGLRDDKYYHFNPYCKSIQYVFNLESLEKISSIQTKQMSNVELLGRSKSNSDLTREISMNFYSDIENIFKTHDPRLISIVRWCDDDARKRWYLMYKKFYTGKSFEKYLTSYDTFIRYLDNCKSLNKPSSLYWYLKNNLS
jgi:hypothetical protein